MSVAEDKVNINKHELIKNSLRTILLGVIHQKNKTNKNAFESNPRNT